MNIFEYDLDTEVYIPNLISNDFRSKNICFFDIETTGLSSNYNQIILIGVLCLEGDRVYIKQFFADRLDEEKEILTLFKECLYSFDHIVSYNGKSFDIPFLKNRFSHYNILNDLDIIPHLDLLQLVRKNKELLGLANCKLKTVEKYLNIHREDTISGKESVDLYKAYLYSNDKIKRDIILKHNYDDIFYLPKLLSLYDTIEKESILSLNINFKDIDLTLNVDKQSIEFQKSIIRISGSSTMVDLPYQLHYSEFYTLDWSTLDGVFNLQLFYETGDLSDGSKCLYLDIKNSNLSLNNLLDIDYNIPSHLIPLKINSLVLYDNFSVLIKNIISQLD